MKQLELNLNHKPSSMYIRRLMDIRGYDYVSQILDEHNDRWGDDEYCEFHDIIALAYEESNSGDLRSALSQRCMGDDEE